MSSAWGFWILFSVQVLSVHSEVFVDKGGYIMYYLRVPDNNPTQAVPLLQGAGDQLKFSFRHCNKDGGLLLYQGGSGNTYFAIGVYNNGIYIEMNLNDTLVEMSGGTGPSGVFADVPDSRYTEVTIVGLRQPEHANVTVDGRTVMLSTSTPGIQGPSFTTDMLGSLVIGGANSHVMMKTEKLNKDLIPCISFIDVGLEGRTLDFNSADVKHWVSPMCPANSCFSGTSATFTSVDSYVHLDVDVSPKNQTFIGFKFRTRMKAGLLFFFGGPGGWLALYLRNGALVLRLNTEGRGRDAMKTTSESTFNDGEWHEVRVVRQGDKAVLFDGNGHAAALVTYGSGEMLKPLHVTALYVGGANTTVIPGVTSALLGCMEEFIFASFDAVTESQPRGLSLSNNNIDSRHVVFEGCTESESCDPRCPSPAQTCSLGVCDCAPGHSEVTRDPLVCSDIDDCAEEPCVHGVCTDQPNDYICECTPEYKGRNCSMESSCYKFPCSNGATCVEDQTSPPGIESRTCHCFQGYEGVNCSKDIDECSENACVANITRACVNYPGGFSCLCVEGWTGQDCSEEITPCHKHPCGLGVCNVTTGGYNCTCPDGTIGQECARILALYRQSHLPIIIGVAVVITIVLCALLYILLKKGKCKGMEICLKNKIFGDRGYRYRDIYAVS